jgi:hypothetical protein
MLGALDAPAELDRAGERSETLANCQGNDACRGVDAGTTTATYINTDSTILSMDTVRRQYRTSETSITPLATLLPVPTTTTGTS